jgi:membrane-bound lytic murein transglycosylase B
MKNKKLVRKHIWIGYLFCAFVLLFSVSPSRYTCQPSGSRLLGRWQLSRKNVSASEQLDADTKSLIKYESLISFFEASGLPRDEVEFLFQDPRVEFYPHVIYNYLTPPPMDKYSSILFHTEGERYNLYEFMYEYDKYLTRAEDEYSVEKEIIAAILYIETKLGKDIGKYSIFNILSSIAIYGDEPYLLSIDSYVQEQYHYLPYDRRQEIVSNLKSRALEKSRWAKKELYSLIELHLETHMDILELPGSYAGAFGFPQFMPSNVLYYGVDADANGIVDLYSFPDAIMSTAKFLHEHGWNTNRRKALWRYNNSDIYVTNVLKIASTLKALASL